MGVDAVGRAGDEGDQVASRDLAQGVGLLGLDDGDVVDLVLEGLPQGGDVEDVALLELVEVVEHGRGGQPGVAGEDCVGGGAADRQARAEQVPDAFRQGAAVGAVVDGQAHVDGGDDDPGHDRVDVHLVEVGLVLGGVGALRLEPGVEDRRALQVVVVGLGGGALLGDGLRSGRVHGGGVHLGQALLLVIVVLGRHDRVQEDGDADQDQDQRQPGQEALTQDLAAGRLLRVGRRGGGAVRAGLRGRGVGFPLGLAGAGLGDAVAK